MKTTTMMTILTMMSLALAATASAESNVAQSADDVQPLHIGAKAPTTVLRDIESEEVALHEVLAKKPTILIFYRGGWCMYCTAQLSAMAQIESDLQELGYQIIGVSPDRPEKLRESIGDEELPYTLLSDSVMDTAKAFGVAFQVDADTVEAYKGYGIDLNDASGEGHHFLPVPSVFVLGTDGTIHFKYVNPDYTVRLDPDVLFAAAKAASRDAPQD